ncbi:hypothetical protein BDW62DRAFT_211964 [Aspergillus aurantiobrunneus]
MPQNPSVDLQNPISPAGVTAQVANPPAEVTRDASTSDPPLKPHKAHLRGFITLSGAEEDEEDMRPRPVYAQQRGAFYEGLAAQGREIKSIVALHCGLPNPDLVHFSPMYDDTRLFWIHGSFNVCIPVTIEQPRRFTAVKLAFRVPLPYKVGEHHHPGNCEEKVRSEAATYIWINENCPDVQMRLYEALESLVLPVGMGYSLAETQMGCMAVLSKLLGRTGFCDYIPLARSTFMNHGYTLIDWIDNEEEQMLSNVFRAPHPEEQTQNLYRSMAKVIVSLARVQQRRIGSWTISNDGWLSLSNRPLFCHLQELENLDIPSGVARNTTYTSADTLCLDLLDGHDNRLRYQGNAAFDETDARRQAVDLVFMRSTLSQFTDRSLRDGPFLMNLTDMHTSNIFVDKEWNVKHIIDLEWAYSLPLEHLLAPGWLTDRGIDQLTGLEYEKFEKHYRLLTAAIRQQEVDAPIWYNGTTYSLAATMDRALDKRHYWYLIGLQCPKGLFNLCRRQLHPLYDQVPKETLCAAVSPFRLRT